MVFPCCIVDGIRWGWTHLCLWCITMATHTSCLHCKYHLIDMAGCGATPWCTIHCRKKFEHLKAFLDHVLAHLYLSHTLPYGALYLAVYLRSVRMWVYRWMDSQIRGGNPTGPCVQGRQLLLKFWPWVVNVWICILSMQMEMCWHC